jgi:3-oxoacyl-[acyl-carrier protein] reductase
MKNFDLIKIGKKAELKHTITQKDIEKFVDLTGDNNKLHVDSEYAKLTSFKKPVAHGMLGASFISTIIGTKLPGDGALWYSQSLEFLSPVRIGDTLTITAEVMKKISRIKGIEINIDIINQNKQKVISGVSKVKLIEQIESTDKIKELSSKTALVIGGTGGIGSATCRQLAKNGFNIAIHYYKNKDKAKFLKKEIEKIGQKATIISGSIDSIQSANEIREQSQRIIGNISVIINCATIPIANIKFSDVDWNDIQAHFDTNIKISFNLLKAFIPQWENDKFGKFIGLTTLYTEQLKSELLGYITSKTALNGFIKALAFELAPKGIRLNLVSPGMVDTNLIAEVPEKVRLLSAAQTPLRSLAKAEDVANAVSFLASNKSNYITGETIRVNGGQFML